MSSYQLITIEQAAAIYSVGGKVWYAYQSNLLPWKYLLSHSPTETQSGCIDKMQFFVEVDE